MNQISRMPLQQAKSVFWKDMSAFFAG
jgi:hypothetical protein